MTDRTKQDSTAEPRQVYLYLLVSQVALTVLYPFIGDAVQLAVLLEIFLVVALIGGVLPSITNRRRLLVTTGLAVLFLLTRWYGLFLDVDSLTPLSSVFATLFFGYVAVVMIGHIFAARQQVDTDLIYGAISVYLLIGVAFGFAYVCLATLAPDAFTGIETDMTDRQQVVRNFNYFSFVTLTTLGYGDITPQSHQARVLAYVEAIIGQVYLTVLVARLVGMYVAQRRF